MCEAGEVSSLASSPVPPGWYPDPGGDRQWRVWTGAQWSSVTRPYGELATPRSLVADLPLIQALRRLLRFGIAGTYAGLGVLVSVLAHWPGTANPVPEWFGVAASSVAVALLLLGAVSFAFAGRELEGRWEPWAFVPGINVLMVNALVSKRLNGQPLRRVWADGLLIVFFVVWFRTEPWLCVAPMIVAVGQSRWITALLDHLVNSTSPSTSTAL